MSRAHPVVVKPAQNAVIQAIRTNRRRHTEAEPPNGRSTWGLTLALALERDIASMWLIPGRAGLAQDATAFRGTAVHAAYLA